MPFMLYVRACILPLSTHQGTGDDYSWTQSAKDVFLTVPCDAGTRGKDVSANLAPSTISLCIKVSLVEYVTVNARA